MTDDIEKQARKAAATRIGAVAGAKASDILGRMFANWAAENPREAEELFARVMNAAGRIMAQIFPPPTAPRK